MGRFRTPAAYAPTVTFARLRRFFKAPPVEMGSTNA